MNLIARAKLLLQRFGKEEVGNITTFQVEIDEGLLANTKEITGIESTKDLLNHSLALIKWAARQTHEGRLIISTDFSSVERELTTEWMEKIIPSTPPPPEPPKCPTHLRLVKDTPR